jgi:hypothetical protein
MVWEGSITGRGKNVGRFARDECAVDGSGDEDLVPKTWVVESHIGPVRGGSVRARAGEKELLHSERAFGTRLLSHNHQPLQRESGCGGARHRLCKQSSVDYLPAVRTTEILNELPKLTEADQRAIRQVLLEPAEKNDEVAACNQAALDGARMLDRMEDEDARCQSR